MTDDIKEEKNQLPAEKKEAAKKEVNSIKIGTTAEITDIESLYRFSQMHVAGGMIPDSYKVYTDSTKKELDVSATASRVGIGIGHGIEIGLPPFSALKTICIINDRPCLWGDGAVALVQGSGKVEYIKSYYEGERDTDEYTAVYTIKRKDQSEAYTRTFSLGDARAANLLIKKGPWKYGYRNRMLMMRAQAWALRDACSDILMGVGIAEEVRDYQTVEDKREETSISSLDDDFTPEVKEEVLELEDQTDEQVILDGSPSGADAMKMAMSSEDEPETITDEMVEDYKAEQASLLGDE